MSELYRRMQPFLGDERLLIERMAGQLDLWEECVVLFPKYEIIEEMDAAVQTQAEQDFYALVHRLKGNLANFGFDSAASVAMEVLQALREQDFLRAAERYRSLRALYIQIIERIGEKE